MKPGDKVVLVNAGILTGLEGTIVRRAKNHLGVELARKWIVTTPGQDHASWSPVRDGWELDEDQIAIAPEPDDPEFEQAREKWLKRL